MLRQLFGERVRAKRVVERDAGAGGRARPEPAEEPAEESAEPEPLRVAECPVCTKQSRPRAFVDPWSCVASHMRGCAAACPAHAAAKRALDAPRPGCPACRATFATKAEALRHFAEAADAAHEACRARRTFEVRAHSPRAERLPVAGAPGWERVAADAQSADPMRAWVEARREAQAAESLYAAAKMGDVAQVRQHLRAGADPDRTYDDGYTALMTASEAGHVAVVEALAEDPQCDLNLRNSYGQSALHFAAQHGRKAVCEALVQRGARSEHRGGRTAAACARQAGHGDLADDLAAAAAAEQLALLERALPAGPCDSLALRVQHLCEELGLKLHEEDEAPPDFGDAAGVTCAICLCAPASTALAPCFHASFCHACAQSLVPGKCPICRTQATACQRIYF